MFFKKYREKLAKNAEEKALEMVRKQKEKEERKAERLAKKKHEEKMEWVHSVLGTINFNYGSDEALDKIFKELLLKKITEVDTTTNTHYTYIHTSDDYVYKVWTENRYYGWLSRGSIKLDGRTLVKWDEAQPSPEVIAEVKERLTPTYHNKFYKSSSPKVIVSKEFEENELRAKNIGKLMDKI